MFYSKQERDILDYMRNPNVCKNCGKAIYPDDTRTLAKVKKMKFCCSECKKEYGDNEPDEQKEKKCESGIYYIKNLLNDKIYVGQTKHLNLRYGQHKYKLNKGKHTNYGLQEDWDSYGEKCFEFGILERCPEEKLDAQEEYWINKKNAYNEETGYNRNAGGQSGYSSDSKTRKMRSENHAYINGENNSNSKLTWDIVHDIRNKFKDGRKPKKGELDELAEEYGVSVSTIRKIKNNSIWKQ